MLGCVTAVVKISLVCSPLVFACVTNICCQFCCFLLSFLTLYLLFIDEDVNGDLFLKLALGSREY